MIRWDLIPCMLINGLGAHSQRIYKCLESLSCMLVSKDLLKVISHYVAVPARMFCCSHELRAFTAAASYLPF